MVVFVLLGGKRKSFKNKKNSQPSPTGPKPIYSPRARASQPSPSSRAPLSHLRPGPTRHSLHCEPFFSLSLTSGTHPSELGRPLPRADRARHQTPSSAIDALYTPLFKPRIKAKKRHPRAPISSPRLPLSVPQLPRTNSPPGCPELLAGAKPSATTFPRPRCTPATLLPLLYSIILPTSWRAPKPFPFSCCMQQGA